MIAVVGQGPVGPCRGFERGAAGQDREPAAVVGSASDADGAVVEDDGIVVGAQAAQGHRINTVIPGVDFNHAAVFDGQHGGRLISATIDLRAGSDSQGATADGRVAVVRVRGGKHHGAVPQLVDAARRAAGIARAVQNHADNQVGVGGAGHVGDVEVLHALQVDAAAAVHPRGTGIPAGVADGDGSGSRGSVGEQGIPRSQAAMGGPRGPVAQCNIAETAVHAAVHQPRSAVDGNDSGIGHGRAVVRHEDIGGAGFEGCARVDRDARRIAERPGHAQRAAVDGCVAGIAVGAREGPGAGTVLDEPAAAAQPEIQQAVASAGESQRSARGAGDAEIAALIKSPLDGAGGLQDGAAGAYGEAAVGIAARRLSGVANRSVVDLQVRSGERHAPQSERVAVGPSAHLEDSTALDGDGLIGPTVVVVDLSVRQRKRSVADGGGTGVGVGSGEGPRSAA